MLFFYQLCDVNSFEELKMDTHSFYLALEEEALDECILPSERSEWTEKRSKDCPDKFRADAKNNIFPRSCCSKHIKHDNMTRENQDCLRKSSDAPKCCACVVKFIDVTIIKVRSIRLAIKG